MKQYTLFVCIFLSYINFFGKKFFLLDMMIEKKLSIRGNTKKLKSNYKCCNGSEKMKLIMY